MTRRGDGELEREVMQVLWNGHQSMSASNVRNAMSGNLAYTSVATVLARLWDKGLVERRFEGRAYVYKPTVTRDEWFASKMTEVLRQAPNHRALLAGFVGKLSKRDQAELRRLLLSEDE